MEREFEQAVAEKKEELRQIDQSILRVRQLLQLVRYGAVSSYYAGCQPRQTDSTDTMVAAIHPAVKRTLQGKAPAKRTGPTVSPPNMQLSGQTVKRPETVTPDQHWPRPSISSLAVSGPRYIPPRKKEDPFQIKIPRGAQHKVKKRIVVGNVSKWISEDLREGESTHKWMVYVRGDKDSPELPQVEKVTFTLDPSYHPHQVVEVSQPPFHLTRRGWGEFPLRIKITFKNKDDKAVEVVHQLKLDKNFTGHQTLGQETLVDVYLYKTALHDAQEMVSAACFQHNEDEGFVIKH